MARPFRLWEKKRGSRQTGSRFWGGIGEALFYATLLLIGTIALVYLGTSQVLQRGEPMSVWTLSLGVLVGLAFVVLGAGGLFFSTMEFTASAERRSAIAKQASDIDLLKDSQSTDGEFPSIPRHANLTDSPGVKLKYRLPAAQSPTWRMLSITVLWLVSIGIATALVVWTMDGMNESANEFYRVLITTPFVAIAIGTTYLFVHGLLIQVSLGPTTVEISDHPLYPGKCYHVYVSQAGHLSMNWLQLRILCEEEATYQQGTNVRTETRPICSESVFYRSDFAINPGVPFEHECELRVPEEAMHSFQSASNGVHWKLVISGDAAGWPTFEHTFPIIVYPCHSN